MPSEPITISIRELWLQMRGIENAFRTYSDALNGIAGTKPDSYEFRFDVDGATYAVLAPPFERDCPNPPWCTLAPAKTATGFGKLKERVEAVATALQALIATVQGETPIEFYVSEVPGTSWSGQASHSNN